MWMRYPLPLDEVGNIVEDLSVILPLIGSLCYEWRITAGGQVWIRRID